MSLHVEQTETYQGHDRWQWAVWIEGTEAELDGVKSVVWKLHKTFPQPVVRVSNRKEKFRIQRVGWGVFTLGAELEQQDGHRLALTHTLQLTYPSPEAPPGPASSGKVVAPRNHVFLSFSAEDQRFAGVVRDELERAGLRVASSSDLSADVPWEVMARKIIRQSDAFVSLIATDTPSQFVEAEQKVAIGAGLPVIALVRDGVQPSAVSEQANLIHFNPTALRETVQRVLEHVTKLL